LRQLILTFKSVLLKFRTTQKTPIRSRFTELKFFYKGIIRQLLFLIPVLLVLETDYLSAQSMTIGDPMIEYLRILETGTETAQLPSLMIGSMNTEHYQDQLESSQDHPWSSHPFFDREPEYTEIYEEVTTQDAIQTHQVQQGETVYSISRKYGITEEELIEWNEIENNLISIGQILIVEEPKQTTKQVIRRVPKESNDFDLPFQLYTPVLKTTYNTQYPIGQNDGALWQGSGLNTVVSTGAYFSYGPIKVSIRPNFIYSANENFPISRWPAPEGLSDFGYEFTVIDYPQRFGTDPITTFDPGQSWIRVEYREFSAGVSTENQILGPAIYNPIMLSQNAPGFPHLFIGTHQPYQTGIGSFEGKMIWGRLQESNYFDENESNNSRLINGITLIYSPSFVKGLHVGLSKIAVTAQQNITIGGYLSALRPMQYGEPSEIERLQMFSLFSRWKIPDYGFEFYGEWARNTPPKNFRDLILEPEYSRVYTMGFFKRFILAPEHWLKLNFELTQIERPRSIVYRASQPFYRSQSVIQGYTHKGQILGAGIAPGSNSQKIDLSYFMPHGMFGVSFNRIVHDNIRLYENYEIIGERPWGIRNPRVVNEVEFRYGVNVLVFLLDNVELKADLYRTRFFHHEHGIEPFENPDIYNTNLQFTLRYNFSNFHR
jgi:hypothetical protein